MLQCMLLSLPWGTAYAEPRSIMLLTQQIMQVLYSYPPEVQASPDLPSFCFPHGVQPTLLERTPSMTSLNDLLYSQNYLNSDASSFIFLLKVSMDARRWQCIYCQQQSIVFRSTWESHVAVVLCSLHPLHHASNVHASHVPISAVLACSKSPHQECFGVDSIVTLFGSFVTYQGSV